MKLRLKAVLFLLIVGMSTAFSQTATTLTVHVTASTGDDVKGVKVSLSNEYYGLVYSDVTLSSSGIAKFSNVLTTENTLTVDGSALGLEKLVQTVEVTPNMTYEVTLGEMTRQPFALKATLNHSVKTGQNDIQVQWNKEQPALYDDFESYEAFSINFEPWTGIDGDKLPAAQIQGSYPNAQVPQYATIFNPLTIEPSLWYDYPVLHPFSGAQYAAFITTSTGAANNDYLISPRLHIGTDYIVQFMAKAADKYNENFRVGISTTGTSQEDFKWLTPGNYQSVEYRTWHVIEYSLAAYKDKDVYICINYLSQGTFMLMVDDFYVGPQPNATELVNPNEQFVIYLDDTEIMQTSDLEAVIEDVTPGKHRVGVKATYRATSTETIWTEIDVPAAENYAALTVNVTTNNDQSADGIILSITNKETGEVNEEKIRRSKVDLASLPKAAYLLGIEAEGYATVSQECNLQDDTTLDIVLRETITAPYNLNVDVTTGEETASAIVTWNRDLGFEDGFEDYEPFCQDFGDWISVDYDAGTNYGISFSGSYVYMGDFGMTGQTAAMIFNPYKTKPAVDQDAYFLAPEGEQYVVFFSPQGGQADDWLIAPSQKVGKDWVVRFYGKSYSNQYIETIEVLAKQTKERFDSFKQLSAIDLPGEVWTRYELSLKDYEGQDVDVAIHYISRDKWFAQIDDVYIGPASSSETMGDIQGDVTYNIYLDGQYVDNTSNTSFTFQALTPGLHTVGVEAVYASGCSEMVTYQFVATTTDLQSIKLDSNNNAPAYNLAGQRVGSNYKGIIITKGKRVIQ